jgi:thymidylate synthase
MNQYLNLLQDILANGETRDDRTHVGVKSVFGRQLRFNLNDGFPVVTTKRLHLRSIFTELLWFLRGDTNIQYLTDHQVHIWDAWANEHGEVGPLYGSQWRSWPTPDGNTIDQLSQVIAAIKATPTSRRLIVSAWNVAALNQMALPPCHILFQFYVTNSNQLACQVYQRSADVFLGLPFNLASYATLTHLVAQQCQLNVGELIWCGGDVHLYLNHLESANLQLTRSPFPLPRFWVKPRPSLFAYQLDDIQVIDYQAHSHIKAPVAI